MFFNLFIVYYLLCWTCLIVPLVLLEVSVKDRYYFGMVVCLVYLGAGLLGLTMIESHPGTPLYSTVILPFIALHFYAFRRLPSYTGKGQRVMAEIMAYRKYLDANFAPVEKEQQLDEEKMKQLPYVVALDLEKKFTPYFNDILSRRQYSPYQMFERMGPG